MRPAPELTDPVAPHHRRFPAPGLCPRQSIAWGLLLLTPGSWWLAPTRAASDSSKSGATATLQPENGSLLVEYYEGYLRTRDPDQFRQNVTGRYSESALGRLVQASDPSARRASVLALGMFGGYSSNASVARGLRDPDPVVRALADDALWLIWFRADSPENNESLDQIRTLIRRGRLDQAIEQANALIARAPTFAEAYNQRAIAQCFSGRFAESIEDCQKVLIHNPYHIGALGGMGQCQLRLGRKNDALATFRQALKLQPYSEGLKEVVAELEADDR